MCVAEINSTTVVVANPLMQSLGLIQHRSGSTKAEVLFGIKHLEPLAFPYLYPRGTPGYSRKEDFYGQNEVVWSIFTLQTRHYLGNSSCRR